MNQNYYVKSDGETTVEGIRYSKQSHNRKSNDAFGSKYDMTVNENILMNIWMSYDCRKLPVITKDWYSAAYHIILLDLFRFEFSEECEDKTFIIHCRIVRVEESREWYMLSYKLVLEP